MDELNTRDARVLAKETLAKIAKGEFAEEAKPKAKPPAEVTLRQAWERYRVAHLERKDRSRPPSAAMATTSSG